MANLRMLPIALAPEAEQIELVSRVDEALSGLATLDGSVQTASSALPVLNQSILAKAFRGELVPQDPNDEPASVLLERIRAERAAAAPQKKTRGRRAKKVKAKKATAKKAT